MPVQCSNWPHSQDFWAPAVARVLQVYATTVAEAVDSKETQRKRKAVSREEGK